MLLFVIAILLLTFTPMKEYALTLEILTLKQKCLFPIILLLISNILSTCDAIFTSAQSLYAHLSLSKWLPNCKKNYKPIILKGLASKDFGAKALAVASWLHDDDKRKKLRINTTICSWVLRFVSLILSSIFVIYIPNILKSVILHGDTIIGPLLLFAFIVYLPILIGSILETCFTSAGKKWVKNYYAETQSK